MRPLLPSAVLLIGVVGCLNIFESDEGSQLYAQADGHVGAAGLSFFSCPEMTRVVDIVLLALGP